MFSELKQLSPDTIAILRERFESTVNASARIYNFAPAAPDSDNTYWSLHTERAWQVFLLGARAGATFKRGLV